MIPDISKIPMVDVPTFHTRFIAKARSTFGHVETENLAALVGEEAVDKLIGTLGMPMIQDAKENPDTLFGMALHVYDTEKFPEFKNAFAIVAMRDNQIHDSVVCRFE